MSFKINTGRSRPARYLSTFKLLAKLGSKSGSTCLYVKLNLFEFLENSLSKSSVLFIDNLSWLESDLKKIKTSKSSFKFPIAFIA